MAKYSEKGIVHLKQETESLSAEIHDLIEKKKFSELEICTIEAQLLEKRRLFREFDDSIAIHMQGLKEQERKLTERIRDLTVEANTRSAGLATLKAAISGLEMPVQDFSFVEQAAGLLEKRIAEAKMAHEISKRETENLKVEREKLDSEVKQIRHEYSLIRQEARKLKQAIEKGNDKNGRMGLRYLELQGKIKQIKQRERDSLVMQRRLTPEYQAVFKETQKK